MKTVEKKILPEYFEAILAGKKKYELRLNEFDIEEGDMLVLKEIDPQTRAYTGREITKPVTYVSRFKMENLVKFYSQEDLLQKGLQIISFE